MTTLSSAHRLQRLSRLQILSIPRQRGSFIVSGNPKTLIRGCHSAPSGIRSLAGVEAFLTIFQAQFETCEIWVVNETGFVARLFWESA